MIKKTKRAHRHINLLKIFIFLLPFTFAAMFIYADVKLRPSVIAVAQCRLQSLITKAMNDAIIDQFDNTEITYDDLVVLQKNESGEVTSFAYNAAGVNKLKSEITSAVIDRINEIDETSINMPIGNITNIDMLQNKGPTLKFIITPTAYVEADIESDFQNAGINQVNHQIFIVLKVTGSALIPNYPANITIENKVCVAQTIIIGKVPNNIGNSVIYPSV